MPTVENDLTRDPRPAVIIAGPRTGGTFLAHGLSNHPDVYCERQEVMHIKSSYRTPVVTLSAEDILNVIWGQTGYLVAACKLQYAQAGYPGAWDLMLERGARIIHLRRKNRLRQAVSVLINRMVRDASLPMHPQHSRQSPKRIAVTLRAENLLATARKLIKQEEWWTERIGGADLPALNLTYAEIVGEGQISAVQIVPKTVRDICAFLEIMPKPMPVGLKRVNPWPLNEMIANWADIEGILNEPEFAGCSIKGMVE